jgi:hypothetical protein
MEDRNTGKQILWAIAVLFISLYLFLFHNFFKPFEFSDFFEIIDLIAVVLTVLAISVVLSFLTALIPFRKKEYMRKLSFTFPSSIIFVCLFFGLAVYFSGPRYPSIKTTNGADCLSVRNGTFTLDDFIIERNGDKQIEINSKTHKVKRFTVKWLSNCEYELRFADGSSDKMIQVKIVLADKDGYSCYAWSGKGRAKFCKLTRTK